MCEVLIAGQRRIEPWPGQTSPISLHRQRVMALRHRMEQALQRRWQLLEPLNRELGEHALAVALHRKLDDQSNYMRRSVEHKLAHNSHLVQHVERLLIRLVSQKLARCQNRIASVDARLKRLASGWWRWAGSRVLSDWQAQSPNVHFSPDLEAEDRRLVGKWKMPASEDPESWDELVCSARRAEKSALMYFKQFGDDVQDISIHQLTGASELWTTHDLAINQAVADSQRRNERPIDVKNVRGGALGGFVVPRQPKRTELGVGVAVCGVVSEGGGERAQTIVGESSADYLQGLAQAVENLAQKWGLPLTWGGMMHWQRGLGAWLMEYPPEHYDQYDYLRQIATLGRAENLMDLLGPAPSWTKGLTSFRCGSYGIAATPAAKELAEWHRPSRVSRPAIFIFVLLYLLAAARRGSWTRGRTREELLDLLFVRTIGALEVAYQYPVGLHDPMKTVYAIVTTLDELVFRNRDVLKDVEALHLTGLGVLKGRRRDRDEWFRLLAYCGGCGKSPIWAGDLETLWRSGRSAGGGAGGCGLCDECFYLVCDECGFCKKDCDSNSAVRWPD